MTKGRKKGYSSKPPKLSLLLNRETIVHIQYYTYMQPKSDRLKALCKSLRIERFRKCAHMYVQWSFIDIRGEHEERKV